MNAQRLFTKSGVRGWRSGDIGRHLPSGEFEILGRMDGMRKVKGGFRVELLEIEAQMRSCPEVDKCHVSTACVDNPNEEMQIIAHVVFKDKGRNELEKVEGWKEVRL
jgi:acyl-coenzyme A synthetase/AMP-(fatty) acid ligase